MDNQHRKIKGYRELNEDEIRSMNEIKVHGGGLGDLIDGLENSDADQRWVAIGKTQLQLALMALTRSVAKPDFF